MAPPLTAAAGTFRPSSSMRLRSPTGGRAVVTVKPMPRSASPAMAARVRGVITLAWVTSVPSMSDTMRRMGSAGQAGACHRAFPSIGRGPGSIWTGRHARSPSLASMASAATGPAVPLV